MSSYRPQIKFFIFFLLIICAPQAYSEEKTDRSFPKGIGIKSIETKTYGEITFPKDSLDPRISILQGLGAKTKNSSFSMAIKQNTMEFSSYPATYGNPDQLLGRLSYSISLKTNIALPFLPFNMELMAGTLSQGKSVSRMRKPSFSTPLSLSSPQTYLHGTGASPQSATSASTRFNLDSTLDNVGFAMILFPSKNSPAWLPQTEVMSYLDGDFYTSLHKSFSIKQGTETIRTSFALNASYEAQSQSESESWFQDRVPYPKKRYLALEGEADISSRWFISSNAVCLQENPFDQPFCWLRTQDTLILPFASINSGLFLQDRNAISQGGAMGERQLEAMVNPQFTFNIEENEIKAGILYQYNMCSSRDMKDIVYGLHQLRGQINLEHGSTKKSAQFTMDYSTLTENIDLGGKMQLMYRTKDIKSSTSIGFEGTLAGMSHRMTEATYSLSQSLSFTRNRDVAFPGRPPSSVYRSTINPSMSFQMDFVTKEGNLDKMKLGGSFSLKGRKKGLTWSANGVINCTF